MDEPESFAPTLLLEQVRSTAAWAFRFDPPLPATEILANAHQIDPKAVNNAKYKQQFQNLIGA